MIGKRLAFSADGIAVTGEVVGTRTVKGAKYARVQTTEGPFVLVPYKTAQRLVVGYAGAKLAGYPWAQ